MRAPHRGVHNTHTGSAEHLTQTGGRLDTVRTAVPAVRKGATRDRPTSAWNAAQNERPFLPPWHAEPATRGECPTRKNFSPATARLQRPTTGN